MKKLEIFRGQIRVNEKRTYFGLDYELTDEIGNLVDKCNELSKQKQELIDYLKEQISNLHWEMSELSLGMCDTKFQRGKLSAYEEILSKIKKGDNNGKRIII